MASAASSPEPDALSHTVGKLLPGIIGNRYLPHFPHPKQLAAIAVSEGHDDKTGPFEMLFGGAAGGGKSDWILQSVAERAVWPHYRGVILRRTHAEMMKSGAVLSRAMRWWLPLGVGWNGSEKVFTFPSGATTHWHDDGAFEWLRSRLRTGEGDPIGRRLLATSNPGGPGHQWVKERFVGGKEIGGRVIVPRSFYLPSKISDNPSLDRDAYTATLQDMHPTRRAQLLDGDWSAREPGDYFRLEWFGPLLDEAPTRECVAVRWWDLAASEKESAARTAGVRMVRIVSGVRVVTHATAFRATPGKRDAKIVAQAKLDGRGTVVGIEIEPGSGGIAQFDALAMRLRADGFRVVGARPNAKLPEQTRDEKVALAINTPSDKGKAARADPVASCLERGHQRRGECEDTGAPWWGVDGGRELYGQRDGLRIVAGDWSQGYLDELEGFPEAKLKDLVDATSGAWAWLQAHPFGRSRAPVIPKRTAASQSQDAHPDDRPEPGTEDRSPGGHWRP
jgi:phage terminase large subunit-like protein